MTALSDTMIALSLLDYRRPALPGLLNMLADDNLLHRPSAARTIARQLAHTGQIIHPDIIQAGLTRLETNGHLRRCGAEGVDLVLTRPHPHAEIARTCRRAALHYTDTLPRDKAPDGWETIRPKAFAICSGHLRRRWARGNFAVPRVNTMRGWLIGHFPEGPDAMERRAAGGEA